jgi:Flp pilus assembly pilin Flp
MLRLTLWRSLFRDEAGSEIVEYAIVFAVFAAAGIAAIQALSVTGNRTVETNETNFTNSFVNGY